MTSEDSRPIDIRPYVPSDAAPLTALYRASVHGIAARDYTPEQIRAWAPDVIDETAFGRKCASKATWVAELEGRIAGFSDLELDGHVDMLFVHPDFQRHGVARALLEHIEKEARLTGLSRLYSEASITARPVFEAMGFRVITPQTVVVRGASMTNFKMEKLL